MFPIVRKAIYKLVSALQNQRASNARQISWEAQRWNVWAVFSTERVRSHSCCPVGLAECWVSSSGSKNPAALNSVSDPVAEASEGNIPSSNRLQRVQGSFLD